VVIDNARGHGKDKSTLEIAPVKMAEFSRERHLNRMASGLYSADEEVQAVWLKSKSASGQNV
jgi:hypothetical protein